MGYSLLAIPMPIRICLCACNGPRPCPAHMCGGRGASVRGAGGGLRGPSTWGGALGAAHCMRIGKCE